MALYADGDDPPDEAPDDVRDWVGGERNQHARSLADTKRQMRQVYEEMFGPSSELAAYARKLRYVRCKP